MPRSFEKCGDNYGSHVSEHYLMSLIQPIYFTSRLKTQNITHSWYSERSCNMFLLDTVIKKKIMPTNQSCCNS